MAHVAPPPVDSRSERRRPTSDALRSRESAGSRSAILTGDSVVRPQSDGRVGGVRPLSPPDDTPITIHGQHVDRSRYRLGTRRRRPVSLRIADDSADGVVTLAPLNIELEQSRRSSPPVSSQHNVRSNSIRPRTELEDVQYGGIGHRSLTGVPQPNVPIITSSQHTIRPLTTDVERLDPDIPRIHEPAIIPAPESIMARVVRTGPSTGPSSDSSPSRSPGRSSDPPGPLSGRSDDRSSDRSSGPLSGRSSGPLSGRSSGPLSGRSSGPPGPSPGRSSGPLSGRSSDPPGPSPSRSSGRSSGRSPGRSSSPSPSRSSSPSPSRSSGRSSGRSPILRTILSPSRNMSLAGERPHDVQLRVSSSPQSQRTDISPTVGLSVRSERTDIRSDIRIEQENHGDIPVIERSYDHAPSSYMVASPTRYVPGPQVINTPPYMGQSRLIIQSPEQPKVAVRQSVQLPDYRTPDSRIRPVSRFDSIDQPESKRVPRPVSYRTIDKSPHGNDSRYESDSAQTPGVPIMLVDGRDHRDIGLRGIASSPNITSGRAVSGSSEQARLYESSNYDQQPMMRGSNDSPSRRSYPMAPYPSHVYHYDRPLPSSQFRNDPAPTFIPLESSMAPVMVTSGVAPYDLTSRPEYRDNRSVSHYRQSPIRTGYGVSTTPTFSGNLDQREQRFGYDRPVSQFSRDSRESPFRTARSADHRESTGMGISPGMGMTPRYPQPQYETTARSYRSDLSESQGPIFIPLTAPAMFYDRPLEMARPPDTFRPYVPDRSYVMDRPIYPGGFYNDGRSVVSGRAMHDHEIRSSMPVPLPVGPPRTPGPERMALGSKAAASDSRLEATESRAISPSVKIEVVPTNEATDYGTEKDTEKLTESVADTTGMVEKLKSQIIVVTPPNSGSMPDYENMSSVDQARFRGHFQVMFGRMRALHPQYNIPEVSHLSLAEIHAYYEAYYYHFSIKSTVQYYMLFIAAFWLGIELLFTKALGLNFSGYTLNQLKLIPTYERYMFEFVEKYSGIGSGFSPEVKILGLTVLSAVMYLMLKTFAKWIGTGLAGTIQNFINQFLNGDMTNAAAGNISQHLGAIQGQGDASASSASAAPSISNIPSVPDATGVSIGGFNLSALLPTAASMVAGFTGGGGGGGGSSTNNHSRRRDRQRRRRPRYTS